MTPSETGTALELAFVNARTFNKFTAQAIDDDMLRRLHEAFKWGPTSMNCQPMRLVFVRSQAAKERLAPALSAGNRDKTMAAPVTAISTSSRPSRARTSAKCSASISSRRAASSAVAITPACSCSRR